MLKSLWLIIEHINRITTKLHIVPWSMIQFYCNPIFFFWKLDTLIPIFFFFDLFSNIDFCLYKNQDKKYEHIFFTISHNLVMTIHIDVNFLLDAWFLPLSCISPPYFCNLCYDDLDILKNHKNNHLSSLLFIDYKKEKK